MDLTDQINDWCGDALLKFVKEKFYVPPHSIFEIGAGTGGFTQKLYSYMESGLFEIQDHSFVDLFKNQNALKTDKPSIKTLFEESDFEIKAWPNCAQLVTGNLPFDKSHEVKECISKNINLHQGEGLYAFSFISQVDHSENTLYKYDLSKQSFDDLSYKVTWFEITKNFDNSDHLETTLFLNSIGRNQNTHKINTNKKSDLLITGSIILIET